MGHMTTVPDAQQTLCMCLALLLRTLQTPALQFPLTDSGSMRPELLTVSQVPCLPPIASNLWVFCVSFLSLESVHLPLPPPALPHSYLSPDATSSGKPSLTALHSPSPMCICLCPPRDRDCVWLALVGTITVPGGVGTCETVTE